LSWGGQNPAIVDETANIPDAAKKIVWGATAWGGQWCTSPGYAVVHESLAEQFVADCKKAVVELYGVDPKNNPDYSRVISPAAVERLASLIDPKKVIYGGKSDAPARYLDPTILYPISWRWLDLAVTNSLATSAHQCASPRRASAKRSVDCVFRFESRSSYQVFPGHPVLRIRCNLDSSISFSNTEKSRHTLRAAASA
jgi:hypothetical protein